MVLNNIFNTILILSIIFILFSDSAIHALLFLVIAFLNGACVCFLFGADFLGLSLVIIYVGAIAILFLFVVMMLNVKASTIKSYQLIPYIIVILFIVTCQIYILLSKTFTNFNFLEFSYYLIENISNEKFFGQTLYNFFLVVILLSGFLLLIAMIGAIILSLEIKNKHKK